MPTPGPILIIGSGGREEAWRLKLQGDSTHSEVYGAPGSGKAIPDGRGSAVKYATVGDYVQLIDAMRPSLVVVGPEQPLVDGLYDELRAAKINVPFVGPSRAAARLEGSKAFTRRVCEEAGIPGPRYFVTPDMTAAVDFIRGSGYLVVKADGLAAGKGVVVAADTEGAIRAAIAALENKPGDWIVIEEKLEGRELSLIGLADGERFIPFPVARDYKRLSPASNAPNTGGMGTYSPVPDITEAMVDECTRRIAEPLLAAMAERDMPYRGILYLGIMWAENGPQLLEVNVRFGDPEAQVILPRVRSNLLPYLMAITEHGGLRDMKPLEIRDEATVCVVLASDGYPGSYQTGYPILGLQEAAEHAMVIHAGTAYRGGTHPQIPFVTNGGRFLNLVGRGATLAEARERAYRAVACISLGNGGTFVCRDDIAANV